MNIGQPVGVYWRPNAQFISELISFLAGRRVLEVFAGNGYLASLLKDKGIDVKATSILTSMDAHAIKVYCDVENIDAVQAVNKYGADRDVLVICWPTVTNQVLKAIQLWGAERDIVYIGEVTDHQENHLGGCATDEFFESIVVRKAFEHYQGNPLEKALAVRLMDNAVSFSNAS